MPAEVQKQMITDLLNEMKDLSADERLKLMEKVLDNPNLDSSVRARLMDKMLQNTEDLSPEDRQKLLEKMLENSDNLGKAKFRFFLLRIFRFVDAKAKAKLVEKMLKTVDELPPEEREKLLASLYNDLKEIVFILSLEDLINDPNKKDLVKELLNNGQISNEMKQKIVQEMTKKPIDPSTLLNVLQNSKEIPPEILDKVLQNVENMSGKELSELAKKLDTLPSDMRKRVMREMMRNVRGLDSKTQATIVQEMLRNSVDMDPKVVTDLIVKSFFSFSLKSNFLLSLNRKILLI